MINGVSTGWATRRSRACSPPNSAIQEFVVDTAGSAENEVGGVGPTLFPRTAATTSAAPCSPASPTST